MATKRISDGDVVSLGNTLDELSLPPDQRLLLSAIVSVGSESLSGRSEPAPEAHPKGSFRAQFADSFRAGTPEGDGGVEIKIGR